MENLAFGDLQIQAVVPAAGAAIQLLWTGKSTDRQPAKVLGPYFRQILSAAAEKRVPVEMHFEKLAHFNSSTISSIIQSIQEARTAGVKLILVYDQELKWQKLSFDALRVFAKDELFQLKLA